MRLESRQMKSLLLLSSMLGLSGCSFSSVSWTEGTWEVTERTRNTSSDECDVLSIFESIDPLTYEFGPLSDDNDDMAISHYDTGYYYSGDGEPLTEAQRTAGLENLWYICSAPDYNPELYCRHGIELLHADKWLPQVEAELAEKHCDDDMELVLQYTQSDGGLLSPNEALINSEFNFYCKREGSDVLGNGCSLRMTSRLKPVE